MILHPAGKRVLQKHSEQDEKQKDAADQKIAEQEAEHKACHGVTSLRRSFHPEENAAFADPPGRAGHFQYRRTAWL